MTTDTSEKDLVAARRLWVINRRAPGLTAWQQHLQHRTSPRHRGSAPSVQNSELLHGAPTAETATQFLFNCQVRNQRQNRGRVSAVPGLEGHGFPRYGYRCGDVPRAENGDVAHPVSRWPVVRHGEPDQSEGRRFLDRALAAQCRAARRIGLAFPIGGHGLGLGNQADRIFC